MAVTKTLAIETVKAVEECLNAGFSLTGKPSAVREAARRWGVPPSTVRSRLEYAAREHNLTPRGADFEIAKPISPELPIEDLLERRKKQYARKQQHEIERALIPIKINLDGPIGILHFGDPHVDDDGTDIAALEHDSEVVVRTPGLFAGNIGDTTNNWVGRLARLWAEQSTSAAEARQLAEWFLNKLGPKLLYTVGGNHDLWTGESNLIDWIAHRAGGIYQASEVRMNLVFPNKRQVRVNAHHDFSGHSMWNPAHGSMKAAQMGFRDHILINGHKHVSGYGMVKDPSNGVISHCIQLASYKIFDRYAREKGFRDQNISPSCTTIVNPYSKTERGLVTALWDVDEAADYLTYLRRKWKK